MAEEVIGGIGGLLVALLILDAFFLGWVLPIDPPLMEQFLKALGILSPV